MYLEEIKHQAMNRKIFWNSVFMKSFLQGTTVSHPASKISQDLTTPSPILSQNPEMFTWTMINVLMSILPWKISGVFCFCSWNSAPGLSYQLLIMCCGGPALLWDVTLGNVEPSLTETRDDHFSDLASSYTTSKQSQFWAVLLLGCLKIMTPCTFAICPWWISRS